MPINCMSSLIFIFVFVCSLRPYKKGHFFWGVSGLVLSMGMVTFGYLDLGLGMGLAKHQIPNRYPKKFLGALVCVSLILPQVYNEHLFPCRN